MPDSITKEVFSDIYKTLTIEARDIPTSSSLDPEASTNVTQNNNNNNQRRGRARGRGRGSKGRGSGSHNTRSDNSDKDNQKDQKDQKDHQGIKNAPSKGKSADKQADQQRSQQPQYINSYKYTHYSHPRHPAKTCFYLIEEALIEGQKPRGNIQCYTTTRKGKGKARIARTNAARSSEDNQMIDSGASKTITRYRKDFYKYSTYKPSEEPYSYTNANGKVQSAIGYRKAPIRINTSEGKTKMILVNAYYDTTTTDRLLSSNALEADHGIYYNPIVLKLVYENREEVRLVKRFNGLPQIDRPLYQGVILEKTQQSSIQTTYFYEPNSSDSDSDLDKELNRINKSVSTYEIHRRLSHMGRPYIKAFLSDAILLEEGDQVELYDFDCEACQLGKAKKQISRDKQRRVEKPGMKFHADTQTMNPP